MWLFHWKPDNARFWWVLDPSFTNWRRMLSCRNGCQVITVVGIVCWGKTACTSDMSVSYLIPDKQSNSLGWVFATKTPFTRPGTHHFFVGRYSGSLLHASRYAWWWNWNDNLKSSGSKYLTSKTPQFYFDLNMWRGLKHDNALFSCIAIVFCVTLISTNLILITFCKDQWQHTDFKSVLLSF